MTLSQHLRAAEAAWDMIAESPSLPSPLRREIVASFRKEAAERYWLYPLIEGRRGLPA